MGGGMRVSPPDRRGGACPGMHHSRAPRANSRAAPRQSPRSPPPRRPRATPSISCFRVGMASTSEGEEEEEEGDGRRRRLKEMEGRGRSKWRGGLDGKMNLILRQRRIAAGKGKKIWRTAARPLCVVSAAVR